MTSAKDSMKLIYNTKERGIFYFLTFKDKDSGFVAVCLNLNIIEYGKDPEILKASITEAAFSYLEAVRAKNLSDENLNKIVPEKYLNALLEEAKSLKRTISKPTKAKNIKSIKPDYFEYTKHPYPYSFA